VVKIFLEATLRHCVRHIHANLKNKEFHGLEMKIGFWETIKAYTNIQYKSYLKDIGDVDKAALYWLSNINVQIWSRQLFDSEIKVENKTKNLDESFNSYVGKYKSMLIILLLKKNRSKLMFRFHDRYVMTTC